MVSTVCSVNLFVSNADLMLCYDDNTVVWMQLSVVLIIARKSCFCAETF